MIQHGRGHDFIEKQMFFLRFVYFHCCVVALMSWSIFDRFWEPLGLKNRSKIDQKSIQKSIKKMIQLLIDFGANLTPFWRGFGSQVGAKLAPKSIQEAIKKSIKFWIDFISIFHRFWCPRGSQMGFVNLLGRPLMRGHLGSWSPQKNLRESRYCTNFGGLPGLPFPGARGAITRPPGYSGDPPHVCNGT